MDILNTILLGITIYLVLNLTKWTKARLNTKKGEFQFDKSIKEFLSIKESAFTQIDELVGAPVMSTILSIQSNPRDWVLGSHTFSNKNNGIKVWMANGIDHRRFYDDSKFDDYKMTLLEKELIDKQIKVWKDWSADHELHLKTLSVVKEIV